MFQGANFGGGNESQTKSNNDWGYKGRSPSHDCGYNLQSVENMHDTGRHSGKCLRETRQSTTHTYNTWRRLKVRGWHRSRRHLGGKCTLKQRATATTVSSSAQHNKINGVIAHDIIRVQVVSLTIYVGCHSSKQTETGGRRRIRCGIANHSSPAWHSKPPFRKIAWLICNHCSLVQQNKNRNLARHQQKLKNL